MVLTEITLPPTITNISQILKFAQVHKRNLLIFKDSNCSREVNDGMEKYISFYSDLKSATKLVLSGGEDADVSVQTLYNKFAEMIEEATREQCITSNKLLSCLHSEFVAYHETLKNMIHLLLSKLGQEEVSARNDEISLLSLPCASRQNLHHASEDYREQSDLSELHTTEDHKRHKEGTSDRMETSVVTEDGAVGGDPIYCGSDQYSNAVVKKEELQANTEQSYRYASSERMEEGAVGGDTIYCGDPCCNAVSKEEQKYNSELEQKLQDDKKQSGKFESHTIEELNGHKVVISDRMETWETIAEGAIDSGTHCSAVKKEYNSKFQNNAKASFLIRKNFIKVGECNKVKKDNSKNVGKQTSKSQTFQSEMKATQSKKFKETGGDISLPSADSKNAIERPVKPEIISSGSAFCMTDISVESEVEVIETRHETKAGTILKILRYLTVPTNLNDYVNAYRKRHTSEGIDALALVHVHQDSNVQQGGESAIDSGNNASVTTKDVYPFAYRDLKEEPTSTRISELNTLEDSLKAFVLYPRLKELDRSLENVRQHTQTEEEHKALMKKLDKDLQKLSLEHHPDKVKSRGGTDGQVSQAQKLQAALNATRTVFNMLSKIFLEDIDVDHKYEFFSKLDIGLLGNEDEIENQVYDVLFKISLISEIKQGSIIAEIRKFLTASQHCLESYIESDASNFETYRRSAFNHLNKCIKGYEKLLAEFEEVEEECRVEKLKNVYPLIREMRKQCSKELKHLETLSELSKRPFGDKFQFYRKSHIFDSYFVLPFVSYVDIIMTCCLMNKNIKEKKGWFNWNLPCFYENYALAEEDGFHDDDFSVLYCLALYHGGNTQCKTKVNKLLKSDYVSKENIKKRFRMSLRETLNDLKCKFKVDDYNEKSIKGNIAKELKICKEMKTEFEGKIKEIAKDVKEINKSNKEMKNRFDKLFQNNQEISEVYNECLAENKTIKEKIENYSRNKMN